MKPIQIAIDGPASAGKSTIAKIIAQDLGYVYVDTGAMYRAATLAVLKAQIDPQDEQAVSQLVPKLVVTFTPGEDQQEVFLDGQNVTAAIRSQAVVEHVSVVAAYQTVRQVMTAKQRELAQSTNVVMDGRDIGTTVLPQAQVKIFLVASVKERAERRYKENQAKGINQTETLAELETAIKERDYLDSHRALSPLKQAQDAVKLDTTGLTIDQVVAKAKALIAEKLSKR